MTRITLAFYKGRAKSWWFRSQDFLVRKATNSPYSHVEMINGFVEHDETVLCYSSSGRDGGVRKKNITMRSSHWDLISFEYNGANPFAFIEREMGKRYDYRGLLLSQFFGFGRHDTDKWFCSEIISAAFGLVESQKISPHTLYRIMENRYKR